MHGNLLNLELQLARAEEQFVVAPQVLYAPVSQVALDAQPVFAPQNLGSAERVFDPLAKQIGEGHAEQLVADHVGELHRLLGYGVNQAATIDELAVARQQRLEEVRQLFRHDGKVAIENHEHIAPGRAK